LYQLSPNFSPSIFFFYGGFTYKKPRFLWFLCFCVSTSSSTGHSTWVWLISRYQFGLLVTAMSEISQVIHCFSGSGQSGNKGRPQLPLFPLLLLPPPAPPSSSSRSLLLLLFLVTRFLFVVII
jgi:hypothetical protein